ncbi:MAG TPA: hypothetical protein DEW46_06820 [Verrucomicrobia bacterium]|nr:hypothetical protein [Verrucomicrobiota bacterium]
MADTAKKVVTLWIGWSQARVWPAAGASGGGRRFALQRLGVGRVATPSEQDGEDSRRGAEAQREDRECRNVASTFCNCLGQQAAAPLKGGLDQGIDFTHPHGQIETPPRPLLGRRRHLTRG